MFAPAAGIIDFFDELMGLPSMNPLGLVQIVQRHPEAVQLAAPYAQIAAVLG